MRQGIFLGKMKRCRIPPFVEEALDNLNNNYQWENEALSHSPFCRQETLQQLRQ
jgi:hypothetical protein